MAYSAAYAGLKVADEELKGLISFLKKSKEIKITEYAKQMLSNAEKLYAG